MFTSDAPHLTEWAPQHWPVAPDWQPLVERFLTSAAGQALVQFLRERLAGDAIIYPPQPLRALALSALAQVKVVILGQDPYHGPAQAEGLAFSVAPGIKLPPSLRNIFLEIAHDPLLGPSATAPLSNGSLVHWAEQGVLLLNTCLTVEAAQPASHAQRGWEALTDELVRAVASKDTPVVFLLWGAHAQAKRHLIAATGKPGEGARAEPLVLIANHPSPLSARRAPQPFIGCGHFGLANACLQRQGCAPIAW